VNCSGLTAGNYTIAYSGDSLKIDKAPLAVNAHAATMIYNGTAPTLTWTLSGFRNGQNATSASVGGSASCSIAASAGPDAGSYTDAITCAPGNLTAANYSFATGSKGKLTITPADQTITFPPIAAQTLGAADFDPGASASSGRPVSYAASPTGTCTIVAGKVHIVGIGSCTVTASQAGNSNYNPAPSVQLTFAVDYRWDGFLQPINDTAHRQGAESVFKLGSTVPAKFQLKTLGGTVVQAATLPTFTRSTGLGACNQQLSIEFPDADPGFTGTTFRWDGTAQQYIYNWSTKGLKAGEYRIFANLDDRTKGFVDICLQ
jgi:hypothetical protein